MLAMQIEEKPRPENHHKLHSSDIEVDRLLSVSSINIIINYLLINSLIRFKIKFFWKCLSASKKENNRNYDK